MSSPNQAPAARSLAFPAFLATLLCVLLFLFGKSLNPDYTVFSNDGPLGIIHSEPLRLPDAFTGTWQTLNWIGRHETSAIPSITWNLLYLLGPLQFSKHYPAITILFLGLAAWVFFRQMGANRPAAAIASLATALNMNILSNVAWGLGTRALAFAAILLALACLLHHHRTRRLPALALAGFCTGLAVMEGFDVGAILSLYVAGFAAFLAFQPSPSNPQAPKPNQALVKAGLHIAVVAVCAAFIAASTLISLVETQLTETRNKGPREKTPPAAAQWEFATQWSLPKIELLRILIPGLYGYGMPEMYGLSAEAYGPGIYWGSVGEDRSWENYKDQLGRTGSASGKPQGGTPRFSGAGEYAGIPVVAIALFALLIAFRKNDPTFSPFERRLVRFWTVVAILSVLLGLGRYAPFYQLVFHLPFLSTIRNPIKYLHPFHLALLALFAHGLVALTRRLLESPVKGANTPIEAIKTWWKAASGPERSWGRFLAFTTAGSALIWFIYASSKKDLARHILQVNHDTFSEAIADRMASFSIQDAGFSLVILALTTLLCLLVLGRFLTGRRATLAWVLLGLLLTTDLARANRPWIMHYNWREKYATNPILDQLRTHPERQRVSLLPFQLSQSYAVFQNYYFTFWLQHQFQYYDIQSLDIIQEPRVGADKTTFLSAFPNGNPGSILRYWQLVNNRLVFGLGGNFTSLLNDQLDPARKRFKTVTTFDLVPDGNTGFLTAKPGTNGAYALIEFTGALPRARLYSQWTAESDDTRTLARLTDPNFDPEQQVLVDGPVTAKPAPGAPGTVEITDYHPRRVTLSAQAASPSVLLLNDRYAADWQVSVDEKPASLLRCNYIMRGVELPAGNHTVEFRFSPPSRALAVSLAALAITFALALSLAFTKATPQEQTVTTTAA